MTLSIDSDLEGSYKTAVLITFAFVCAVSVYVVLFNLISFDGAFNSQAAINLYSKGTLSLNYRPSDTLQTLLPFQVVNGFFLTSLGNNFLAASLANVFFYVLLFGLFVFLASVYRSLLPLLAFSVISLCPAFFVLYGFRGHGEIPALTLGLLGASLLVFRKDSHIANILAGLLVGCAVTTKWVLVLIFPSVLLTLLLLKPDRRHLLCFGGALFFTVIVVWYLQFWHLEPDEVKEISESLVWQNIPHHGSEYLPQKVHGLATYGSRLKKIWEEYSLVSLAGLAPIKIALSFLIFFVAMHLLFSHGFRLKAGDIFFVFIASFLFVYLAWAFVLNSRWPPRRMLNMDVLLYLAIGLLPRTTASSATARSAVFGLLTLFLIAYSLFFVGYVRDQRPTSVITYESQMKKGLKLLPDGYNGYGNGFLEAPHWSFLSEKRFKDVLRDSVFYSCIEDKCYNYLFSGPENPVHTVQLNLVKETFRLTDVFEFNKFRIARIEGFSSQGKKYVEQIDFSKEGALESVTRIHRKTRRKMYRPPAFEFNEMAVFLDNTRQLPLIEVVFTAHRCHDGKNLRVALIADEGKHVRDFSVSQGKNRLVISVPEKFRGSKIDVYLLLEKTLRNHDSYCQEKNINRIPIEYKKIQLLAGPNEVH